MPKIKSKGRIIAVCRSIECVKFYLYACYMIGTMNEAYHYFNYNNTILDLWLYQSYVPHPKQSTRSRNSISFVSIDMRSIAEKVEDIKCIISRVLISRYTVDNNSRAQFQVVKSRVMQKATQTEIQHNTSHVASFMTKIKPAIFNLNPHNCFPEDSF